MPASLSLLSSGSQLSLLPVSTVQLIAFTLLALWPTTTLTVHIAAGSGVVAVSIAVASVGVSGAGISSAAVAIEVSGATVAVWVVSWGIRQLCAPPRHKRSIDLSIYDISLGACADTVGTLGTPGNLYPVAEVVARRLGSAVKITVHDFIV